MTLPLLASGIVGTVGVATHWTGPDHQEMFDLWEKGDTVGARLVNSRMLESFAFETGDDAPNPIPTKAMMRHLGLAVGQARLPMGPAPAFVDEMAPKVLANLQRWRDAFPERPDTSVVAVAPIAQRDVADRPSRCASSSSAGSVRSAATAWPSSRAAAARATSCSSTAG